MRSPIALTNGVVTSGGSSETPTNVTSLYFFCSSVRCGMLILHGPHQVAQNSTTYTFPGVIPTGPPLIQVSPWRGYASGSTMRLGPIGRGARTDGWGCGVCVEEAATG